MRTLLHTTTMLAALVLVSACANGPDPESFGGRLQAEGGEVARIGETWTEGEAVIRKGRAMIDDGEDEIDDGEDLIASGKKKMRRGEDLVRKGERMKREAEEAYSVRGAKPAES